METTLLILKLDELIKEARPIREYNNLNVAYEAVPVTGLIRWRKELRETNDN